jgi:hypothetical protein
MRKFDRIEIVWHDIVYNAGWNPVDELPAYIKEKNYEVVQVGYFIEYNNDFMIITDSFFVDKKTFGTIHKIPKSVIKKIKKI